MKKTVNLVDRGQCLRPGCKHTTPRAISLRVAWIAYEGRVCRCCERKYVIGLQLVGQDIVHVEFLFKEEEAGGVVNDFAQLSALSEGR